MGGERIGGLFEHLFVLHVEVVGGVEDFAVGFGGMPVKGALDVEVSKTNSSAIMLYW